jgi:hypothetical protein
MFEHKEHLLRVLLEEQRQVPVNSIQYFDLVRRYNDVLNSMVDTGLSEPLTDDLLIDPQLLSDKYFNFERRCEQSYTIDRFVKEQCSFICLTEVERVGTSSVRARVLEQYLGRLPQRVEIGFFIPWGFDTWYKKGERALVFLDRSLTSLGLMGRMPVFLKGGKEYAASYSEHEDFWAYRVDVTEEHLDGERVFGIELTALQRLISSICQGGGSIVPGGVKWLTAFRKVKGAAEVAVVDYVSGETSSLQVNPEENPSR